MESDAAATHAFEVVLVNRSRLVLPRHRLWRPQLHRQRRKLEAVEGVARRADVEVAVDEAEAVLSKVIGDRQRLFRRLEHASWG